MANLFYFFITFICNYFRIAQCLSLMCALVLPSVSASIYFYYTVDSVTAAISSNKLKNTQTKQCEIATPISNEVQIATTNPTCTDTNSMQQLHIEGVVAASSDGNETIATTKKAVFSNKRAFSLLWSHFKTSYSNKSIVLWSVWWALATCGMYQVSTRARKTKRK